MLAWNDVQVNGGAERAMYIAETERVSVREEARATTRNQWLSTIVNVAFLGCSFAAFVMTDGSPMSFGFLAVPGVTVAVNVITKIKKPK